MVEINVFFWRIKPKKWIKLKKYTDFGQAGKISVQLNDEYHKNGENGKIQKNLWQVSLKFGLQSENYH